MRKPRILVPPEMDGFYHVVSRISGETAIFGEEEKAKFREFLAGTADFSGIEVIAWCPREDRFHLLLKMPARTWEDSQMLAEAEVLGRLRSIYTPEQMLKIEARLARLRGEKSRRKFLGTYTRRMGDLSLFMKLLKQRFTCWYNRHHQRKGTLWEDRFQSTAIGLERGTSLAPPGHVLVRWFD